MDGDHDRLQRLEDALALWPGPALEEFQHEDWARSESARLTALQAAAVEDHATKLMRWLSTARTGLTWRRKSAPNLQHT